MKKALGVLIVLLAPFSVQGATIYQQLTDSSSEVTLYNGIGTCTATSSNIATFMAVSTVVPTAGSFAYGVFFNDTGGPNTINITISSTTNYNALHTWSLSVPSSDADQFLEVTAHSGTEPLLAGETYVVHGCDVGSEVTKTRSNLSEDFWYGYITDDGVESVPVAPGIPGFTDVGIATTSQQTYCSTNFSTSTGLLDSIGQSISLGFCNVGVFLFVPSLSAVATFQNNWDTLTTTKFPFSWVVDARETIDQFAATSSQGWFAVSIPTGSTTAALGFTSIEVISTSTLSYYLPDSVRDTIKVLIGAVFYLLAIGYVYRDLQGIWHKQV